jgi:thiol-disulfide isomerase/thioredoxin
MKTRILFATLFVCLPLLAQTNAISPARLQAAERLLDAMRTEGQLQRTVEKIVEEQTSGDEMMQKTADIMTAFFTKYINYSNLRPQLTEVYAAAFNDDELQALTAFYQSPAGSKYSDVGVDLQEQVMRVTHGAARKHIDELREQMEKRMAELAKAERAKQKAAAKKAPTVTSRKIGDPAPALAITQWIKGAAVNLADGKGTNIYVVEFWATWCGPCRRTIPHLSEMQRAYKDKGVVMIGISDEDADVVTPFVEKMGTNMEYVVALDRDKETSRAYMRAFGVNGIPHAFVIDKNGVIVWQGHPLDGLDRVLDRVVAGTFDPRDVQKLERAQELLAAYQGVAQLADEQELLKLMGARLLALGGHDPQFLNEVAWSILTDELAWRDLALAETMAAKAAELTQKKEASVLDTYARALAVNGKKDDAIAMQEKAIALCTDKAEQKTLRQHLKQIKAGKYDKK